MPQWHSYVHASSILFLETWTQMVLGENPTSSFDISLHAAYADMLPDYIDGPRILQL